MNSTSLLAGPVVSRSWPIWIRYGSTLLIVAAATYLNYWIWPDVQGYPFLTFLFSVVLASLLFDRGSGFVAIGASTVATTFLFLEPLGEIIVSQERDVFALLLFIALSLATAAVIEVMHLSVHELHSVNSELARSEREKDLLLREAAHRTRNDLTILAALVSLQERAVEEPAARSALTSIAERIRILLRVQERLTLARDRAVLDTSDFITALCDDLKEYFLGLRPITVRVQAERHYLSQSRAVAIGLIMNEFLTNVLKYAFPEDRPGTVTVRFVREEDNYRLIIKDDGVGIGEGGREGSGLGQRLVRSMAAQLGGSSEVGPNHDGPGTTAKVSFPVRSPDE